MPLLSPLPAGPRTAAEERVAVEWWNSDPRWYPYGTPPREGNSVALLVDGEQAMFAMYEAMLGARDHILMAEWALSPAMEIVRGDDRRRVPPVRSPNGQESYCLRDLLAQKADEVDVRILLWQGLLLFRPRRYLVYRAARMLQAANSRIAVALDSTAPFGNAHHQKIVIVDGRVAFIGGLDVTNFDADRWDSTAHPVRRGRNWHDIVCRVEGPCVADVHRNFAERWTRAARTPCPLPAAPEPCGDTPVQIIRTIPSRVYAATRLGEEGVAYSYHAVIERAERFIYIENQYLWAPSIVQSLVEAIERERTGPFQVAIVLPVRPNIGKVDTDRSVRRLLAADRRQGRVHIYSLYTWGTNRFGRRVYKPIYVHSKLMIADDVWLTAGSANLNTRSMVSDTELNVMIRDETVARGLRLRLWSEHLGRSIEEVAQSDPIDELRHVWPRLGRAGSHAVRRRTHAPPSRLVSYPLGIVLSGVAVETEQDKERDDLRG